jgi:antitoxin (DNA-binding transcriptional repressor) of toxin-antitoxin stability system
MSARRAPSPTWARGWDLALAEQPYSATASWATGQTAYLYLPMPQDRCTSDFCIAGGAYPFKVHIAPLTYEGAAPQSVSFYVNGKQMGLAHPLTAGWQTVEQWVAGLHCGSNTVELRFDWAVSPRTAFPDAASRAVIGTTGQTSPVNLDVHAFSEAYITATGADGTALDASAGRAGYNVAVLDARTGALLDKAGFDTTANTHEADRLAAYLQRIPEGRIVVLATKGAATANLTPAAVAALRGVGSNVAGVEELAGQAHALVGVQGALPGSAAESIASDGTAPDAYLRVAGDFRTLAAAVDWVELGR